MCSTRPHAQVATHAPLELPLEILLLLLMLPARLLPQVPPRAQQRRMVWVGPAGWRRTS